MVVKVKLEGLNIVHARGRFYVYRRATGEALIKGFAGSRAQLEARMAAPDFISIYNRPRTRARSAAEFGGDTLGASVHWYTNGDIDRSRKEALEAPGADENGYPKWAKLSSATRKDYLEAYGYLREEFDMVLREIRQPELYEVRDKCAVVKWPRFADKLIRALSSMFKQSVKRGKMDFNPCLGMDRAHDADPNANREWESEELTFARGGAPMEVLIPIMLARFAGLRGQTLVKVNRKQLKPHPLTGQAVRYHARKNKKIVSLPVLPELQTFLSDLKIRRADGLIAVRDDGTEWASEKEMQTRVSHWLRDRERAGEIGPGTTLHGLRVSYAAWWRRNGATTREVADLIGDESEVMGAHYTRHVEAEANITNAFKRLKEGT